MPKCLNFSHSTKIYYFHSENATSHSHRYYSSYKLAIFSRFSHFYLASSHINLHYCEFNVTTACEKSARKIIPGFYCFPGWYVAIVELNYIHSIIFYMWIFNSVFWVCEGYTALYKHPAFSISDAIILCRRQIYFYSVVFGIVAWNIL